MSMPIRPARTGMVLLEVIVAMTILSVSALAVLVLSVEDADAVVRAQARAAETQRVSNFLNEVALWPHKDLDRHLGERPEGPWMLRIDHPNAALYVISLRDSSATAVLLSTTVYRAIDASNP